MNFYLNSLTRKVKRCFSVIMLVNFDLCNIMNKLLQRKRPLFLKTLYFKALIDNSSKKDKFIDHFIIVNKF